MPTHTIGGALLAMASTDLLTPWQFEEWQTRTGFTSPPWDAAQTALTGWTTQLAGKVLTFATNYWSKSETETLAYMRKKSDNDAEGRDAWSALIREKWEKGWKLNDVIDKVLKDHDMAPYDIMRAFQRKTVRRCVLLI
jgi:hypothetical protein